jgi:hypothetical protein
MRKKTSLSRRDLLFSAGALGLTLMLPRKAVRAEIARDKRFLLDIIVPGGLDQTMLFDARPLAMTTAGAIHNPLNQDPMPFSGSNGQAALTASTAAPLMAVRDRFSIVNGIIMSTAFDGHDQNTNVLLSGSPFGGTSFHTPLNAETPAPLDYVRFGQVFATLQDTKAVELTPPGLKRLVEGVGTLSGMSPVVDRYLAKETAALGDPYDRFGAGVLALDDSTTASKTLQTRLAGISLPEEGDPLEGQLAVLKEVFRLGIARGAMMVMETDDILGFDTHSPGDAQAQGPRYTDLATKLARVFTFLANTAFEGAQSLLEVTTVMVSSEFGRTMRQDFAPITDTGTDHNPLSNSVLIGGAGIKSGLVIGASDFQSATEQLSGAHMELDFQRVKVMGRPFDFTTGMPRADKPATYVATDYLHIASVVNTLFAAFGVDQRSWRSVDRNSPVAPAITQLLV